MASDHPADFEDQPTDDIGLDRDLEVVSAPDEAFTKAAAPRPWGPWATVGWTVLCIAAMFVIQIVVAIVYVVVAMAEKGKLGPEIASEGNLVAGATIPSLLAMLGLVPAL